MDSTATSNNPIDDKALLDAAKEDDAAKFNTAIQAGANVNYQSLDSYFDVNEVDFSRLNSSLHIASLRGCLPIVTRLLELNANCNVLNERGEVPL